MPKKKPPVQKKTATKNRSAGLPGRIPAIKKQRRESWFLWLILGLTAVSYLPSLPNGLIETWDDTGYILENPFIRSLGLSQLLNIFTHYYFANYHPLTTLVYAVQYHFAGRDPALYHATNLLLHLLNVVLAWRFFRLLTGKPWVAAITALLFGVHPVHVESVAWVSELKDVLYTLFLLLSLTSYLMYLQRKDRRTRHLLLASVFFLCSVLSKSAAVVIPLLFFLLDYYTGRKFTLRTLLEKAPFLLISLVFGVVAVISQRSEGAIRDMTPVFNLFQRLSIVSFSLVRYVVRLVLPFDLSAMYPYPNKSGGNIPLYYPLSLLAVGAWAFLLVLYRRKKEFIFASLFFVVTIALVLQLVPVGAVMMADRYAYVPSLAVFFAAGMGADLLARQNKNLKPLVIIALSAFTLYFSVQTFRRCRVWKNSETLWSDVIRAYPGRISAAYANRASYYRSKGMPGKALEDYNVAIPLNDKDASAIMNRGNLYFDMGRDDLALADYMKSLSLKKNNATLYGNLGAIYGRKQEYRKASGYLQQAVRMDTNYYNAFLNLGLVYENLEKFDSAIHYYTRYLHFKPQDDQVLAGIAVCYQKMNEPEQAIRMFDRALALKPTAGLYYLYRSYSYNVLNQKQKALEDAAKAQQLGGKVPEEYLRRLK